MFDAVEFANHAIFTDKHAVKFLNHCKKYLKFKHPEEILEIGCADGRLTKTILYPFVEKYLGHLEAVDYNEDVIQLASNKLDKQKLGFSVMDLESQDAVIANKNKYDHIFLFYVLHLVSEKLWPKNLFNMTKSGGQVFGSIYGAPNALTKAINAQRLETDKPWWKYFENYNEVFRDFGNNPVATVTDYLVDAGFVIDTVDLLPVRSEFPTKLAAGGTAMSANVFSKLLPADMRDEYAKDFIDKFMEHVRFDEDIGAYGHDMNVVVFVASKP